MFENTLMIMKSDFMSKRKCLLLHLLSKGFQIQGNRKLAFTPEDAAEFYQELADDKCYMLYVILLSKGTSEAFILRKENAVEDLLNTMVCYFGTSVEMDRNIHVSRSNDAARREITFIFPNYIHEPLPMFDKHRFCQQPMMAPFIGQAYDILQAPIYDAEANWRTKLSDWLIQTNSSLPTVSNQCSINPQIGFAEKFQQTEPVLFKGDKTPTRLSPRSSLKSSSPDTSVILSSSSCVSCSSFDREVKEPCPADLAEFEARLKTRAIKTLQEACKKAEEEKLVCEEHVEWTKIEEYEDVAGEDELVGPPEAEYMEVGAEIAEHLSYMSFEDKIQELEEMECNPAIEEQVDVEHTAVDDIQGDEPPEAMPPAAETEAVEEKPLEQTEMEAAPPAEPVAAETAEPVQTMEPFAEEKVEIVPEVAPTTEEAPVEAPPAEPVAEPTEVATAAASATKETTEAAPTEEKTEDAPASAPAAEETTEASVSFKLEEAPAA